jgi:hypothetical protein
VSSKLPTAGRSPPSLTLRGPPLSWLGRVNRPWSSGLKTRRYVDFETSSELPV